MEDPKIYLAIDNCFASKRWTRPEEWIQLIKELGINFVEASADTECDPLYADERYLQDWQTELQTSSRKHGVKVANFYSGHGTYSTLGLTHTDSRNREKIQNEWLKPMADLAAKSEAGLGFYCHAFSQSTLENPASYHHTLNDLYRRLAEISTYCQQIGLKTPGVEQMYTPHQVPWTISGSKQLLNEVVTLSNAPFYLTIDTGHMSGQRKFLRPSILEIEQQASLVRRGERLKQFWLGSATAYKLFEEMIQQPKSVQDNYIVKISQEMDNHPYLFSSENDSDPYAWIEALGCYSPIIHLQQTDGTTSSHQPFTEEYNKKGIIFGENLLLSLDHSYQKSKLSTQLPKCDKIYLTLEIFSGTSELPIDIVSKIKESVAYWRKFIPEDGMKLSEAINQIHSNSK